MDAGGIHLGEHHAFAFGLHRQQLAPWVDDQAVAVGAPAAGMRTALGGGDDVSLVLDRPRPQQRLPMRRAGRHGESRRHEHGVEGRERAIELGVAHIVANRKREAPERARHGDRAIARFESAGFVVALIARGKAKEMHLVVACDALAGVVVDQAGAADASLVGAGDRSRAADEPDVMLTRRAAEKILDRAATVGLAQANLVGLGPADAVEIFRQRDEPCPGCGGRGDQSRGGLKVRGELGPGHHLHRRNAHLAHCVAVSVGGGATVRLTTFGSAQLPLTSNSCAKSRPSGSFSTFCASAEATPATGLTIVTRVEAEPPRLGTTRTLSAWLSRARSTRPDIATSAAG